MAWLIASTPLCRYYFARSRFLKFVAFRHVQATKIQAMFRGRRVPRWRAMRDKEMGAWAGLSVCVSWGWGVGGRAHNLACIWHLCCLFGRESLVAST